jgi:hypothetical protein
MCKIKDAMLDGSYPVEKTPTPITDFIGGGFKNMLGKEITDPNIEQETNREIEDERLEERYEEHENNFINSL